MSMHHTKRTTHFKRGFTLLMTLVLGVVFMIVALAISRSALANYTSVRRDYNSLNALTSAEAGVDTTITAMNANPAYTGTSSVCPLPESTSGSVEFYSDAEKGRAVYDTCVENGSIGNEKVIWSRARIYRPAGALVPTATRTVRVTVIASTIPSTNYSVQTGPGGLVMTNSSQISNGAVYIGGTLVMTNTAQIGSSATPVATQVANYVCPQPATAAFPSLCPSGQPISLQNQARIYGNVQANGQTNGASMQNPGLTASSGVAAPTLPDYDRTAHKAAVAANLTGAAASCSGSQQVTWPANVKITGNVTLSNNCQVTINGNAWITGSLSLSNRTVLRVANGITTPPTIMIDGQNGLNLNNQSNVATNNASIGMKIITFWANSACSPDCVNLTGTGLANSQNVTTIQISNQGAGAAAELYSRWSKIQVSNGGTVGRLIGQSINLANTGSISFGLGVSSNPGTTVWGVQYYERR